MKPFNFSRNIKRNLVKITIIAALSFSPSFLAFSNPIVPGPCILEIHFGPEGWTIEMMNVYAGVSNLDNVWMMSENDSAQFVSGIEFNPLEVIVVTQDDFLTELDIDQAGDWLMLVYFDGEEYEPVDWYGLAWGEILDDPPMNRVTASVGEQSIAFQRIE